MKNFLKKYGYIIYLGTCMFIMNPFSIFKILNWLILIIVFISVELSMSAWKDNKILDTNYLLRISWAAILGIGVGCLTPITNWEWWIIDIPIFILCILRILKIEKLNKDLRLKKILNHLKERN